MENLISIILPVKNTEMYLGECLDSIVNQSYQNWELIAVDDFSDDNCFQILKEYSQNDSRIQTYHNQTSGIIGALNLGYSKSSGVFITRMDSDDIMPADKLLNLKQCLDSGGAGFVATGMVQYFSDLPISDGYQQYEHWLNHLTKTASNFDDIYKECPIASPCWMVSRCDFEKSGGFNSKKYPEDYDLLLMDGVGSSWPFVRLNTLLNNLQPIMGDTPLVVFYPGRYDGRSLRLFDKISGNNYYRAFRLIT